MLFLFSRRLLVFAALFLATTGWYSAAAQRSWEIGATLGAAVYQGETMPSYFSLETFQNINPQGGLVARYNLSPDWTIAASAHYGRLSGSDALADYEERRRRNLSFRTDIITAGVQVNYNLFGYQPYNMDQPFSPYILVGVEGFHFNPQAQYQGKWVALQPLGTEGQGKRYAKYSLNQLAIPLGVGMRWAINPEWCVGVEGGIRKTFTDYIDDVGGTYMQRSALLAQNGATAAALGNRTGETGNFIDYKTGARRGSNSDDDWYTFAGITVTHILYDQRRRGEMGRQNQKFGCPRWMRKGIKLPAIFKKRR